MSTNSECEIIGLDNGQWFWVLEDYNAPKNAWDWREYASCGGPYSTAERACDDMRRGHANPGGHWTMEMTVGQAMADKVLRGLIEGALGKALVPTPLPAAPRDVSKYLLLQEGRNTCPSPIQGHYGRLLLLSLDPPHKGGAKFDRGYFPKSRVNSVAPRQQNSARRPSTSCGSGYPVS